ncbi:hypothetical protein LOC68_03215 [Blastopirellula sp. JC732]|uniref:DUF6891 domain-containing protein n=1 Tax=Blastopirellula sediminis TaxID=2894196 RepID=A0A9X1MJC8_9BACT|nr:hypothetical protein [Blastopirellula sediminis]MCC9607812.1 hypothetical protein [Blastopirellula sediminis]MCC9627395.1 hypothetical protein [Blastopirellula sediminis]
MSEEVPWSDQTRRELRESISQFLLGQLRLKRNDAEEILDNCCQMFVEEGPPEEEEEDFEQFAEAELERIAAELAAEEATWPDETDCDRLDRVESKLRDQGIMLWQVSPCCDSCTVSELSYRIDEIERRFPGFKDRVRGYAFFIDQTMPEMLAEKTELTVYLGYGWISTDQAEVAPDLYEANALGIAQEVCRCLQDEGLEPNWDGSFSRKIGVSLNWRRRETIE